MHAHGCIKESIVKAISAHPPIGCLTIQCGGECACIYCSNNQAIQLSRAENGKKQTHNNTEKKEFKRDCC